MNNLRASAIVLGMLVSLLAGCNAMIAGQWRSIEPADVPADAPRIRQITLSPDGRFEGRMSQRNRSLAVSGTYHFDGSELMLMRMDDTGGDTFTYHVLKLGDVLLLTQNQVTHRLCRELPGAGHIPPALSDESAVAPASEPTAPNPAPASAAAVATQRTR